MKPHFENDTVDLRTKGFNRTLLSKVVYYSAIAEKTFTVDIGFETDLGSIPRILQGLVPKDGRALLAYIVHDAIYKLGLTSTQAEADDILEEAQNALGVNSFIRKSVRFGLWLGGFVVWNNHRANDE